MDCVGFPIRPLDSRWTQCWTHYSPGGRPIPLKFYVPYRPYRTYLRTKFEPDRRRLTKRWTALDCVGFPIRPLDSRWTLCWLHCSPGSRPIPLKFGTLYGSYRNSMHAKFEPDRWRFHLVLATVGPILDRCPSYLYFPYSPT